MGLQTAPGFISLTGFQHPAELMRNLNKANFGQTGAIRVGHFAVTPTGVSRQISIAPGQAFLLGTETAAQGGYFTWSEAAQTMLFATPSANPRIDALIMRVADSQYGSIPGSPQAYFEIVQGTPNASPVAPADSLFNTGGFNYVPGAWWRIADVRTNVGNTTIPSNQITHNLRYSRSPGGVIFCTSTTRPTLAVAGDQGYEVDTATFIWYDGTNWHLRPKAIGSGILQTTTAFASTETNILSMTGKNLRNGRRYEIRANISLNATSNADQFNFRVRTGTVLSGTVVNEWYYNHRVNPQDNSVSFVGIFDVTVDALNTGIHLSFVRAAGSGTLSAYGVSSVGAPAATSWEIYEKDFTAQSA